MADVLEGPIEEPETPKLPPAPTPSVPSIKLTPPVPNQPSDTDKPKQPEKPKEGSSEPIQPGTSSSKQGGELKMRPGIRDPEVSNVRKAFGSLFFGSKKSESSLQPENSEFSLQQNFKEPERSEPAPNVAFEFESVVPDSVGAVPPAKSLTSEQFMELDGLIKQLFKSLSTPGSSFVEKQKFLDHFYAEDRITKYLSYAMFLQASQTPQVTLRHVLEKFKTLAPEKFSFSDLYRCFLMAQGQQAPGPESGSHSSPREGMDTLKVPGPQSEVIFEIDRSGDGSSSIQKSKQNDYKPISQKDMLFSSLRSLLNSGDSLPKPKGSNSPDLGSQKSVLGVRALGIRPVPMWSDSSITTFQADPRGMNQRPGVVIEQLEESHEGSKIGGAPTESENFDVLLFPQAVAKFGHNQSFGPIGGVSPTASLQSQQVGGFGARLQKAPTMEMLETNSLKGPALTHGSRKDNPQQASVAQNLGQIKASVSDTLKPFRVLHTPAEPFSQTRKSLERSIASNTKHLLESRLEADRRRERIRAKKAEAEQAKQAKEEMYKALKAKYQERLQAGVHGQSKHGKSTGKRTLGGPVAADGGKRVAQAV